MQRLGRGFTLIELLVVMSIIAILVAGLMTGMSAVRVTANRIRTQQLITRLNAQLMPRFEGYKSRRLPVDPTADLQTASILDNSSTADASATLGLQRQFAWRRLWAARELMRMELPDDYVDLQFKPRYLRVGISSDATARSPYYPASRFAFRDRLNQLRAQQQISDTDQDGIDDDVLTRARIANGSAECLYMIMATTFEDRDLYEVSFIDTDVSDLDNDGVPEFTDAWGEPLRWIRWPAGYVSEMQPLFKIPITGNGDPDQRYTYYGNNHRQYYDPDEKNNYILTRYTSRIITEKNGATKILLDSGQHTAFDSRQIDHWEPAAANTVGTVVVSDYLTPLPAKLTDWKLPERGYNVIPLIFSYGANREGGLFLGKNAQTENDYLLGLDNRANPYETLTNPYVLIKDESDRVYQRGQAVTTADSDNISNHQAGALSGT